MLTFNKFFFFIADWASFTTMAFSPLKKRTTQNTAFGMKHELLSDILRIMSRFKGGAKLNISPVKSKKPEGNSSSLPKTPILKKERKTLISRTALKRKRTRKYVKKALFRKFPLLKKSLEDCRYLSHNIKFPKQRAHLINPNSSTVKSNSTPIKRNSVFQKNKKFLKTKFLAFPPKFSFKDRNSRDFKTMKNNGNFLRGKSHLKMSESSIIRNKPTSSKNSLASQNCKKTRKPKKREVSHKHPLMEKSLQDCRHLSHNRNFPKQRAHLKRIILPIPKRDSSCDNVLFFPDYIVSI